MDTPGITESASKRPRFGPYLVLNLVGKGGMAKVYRCTDTRNGQIVAIKMLNQYNLSDEAAIRAFEREIQAMQQVKHPYIVRLLDYSLTPELSYLVMPYFSGGSVADQLAERNYSPKEAAQVIAHLAFALDYAHSQGYVHRDLKPSNLLLDSKGQIYLSDFGLARSIGASTKGQISGTPPYMAPEYIEGVGADTRSEVYALGTILCELLTGHRPFEAETPQGYITLHRKARPPAPSALNPYVAADLDGVVLEALSKSPMTRPQSAGELAQRFSRVVSTLPPAVQDKRASLVKRPEIALQPEKGQTGTLGAPLTPQTVILPDKRNMTGASPIVEADKDRTATAHRMDMIILLLVSVIVVLILVAVMLVMHSR